MNTNAKTFTVPKISRPFFDGIWLAIASVLDKLNAGYDDYDIRLHMCELTPDEARAEIMSDFANEERNRLDGEWWSGG